MRKNKFFLANFINVIHVIRISEKMVYTIRNVDEKTKEIIGRFADEHRITVAEALQQLIELGLENYEKRKKNPKKYLNTAEAVKDMPGW